MTKKSKIFGVNVRDLLYGLIVAVLSAILTELHQSLSTKVVDFSWVRIKPTIYVGLAAGISYIIKNFFSNSNGKFAKGEKEANTLVEDGPGGSSNPPDGGRPTKP